MRDIFQRGHYFEDMARQHLIAAGFKFAPPEVLAFSAVNGCLRGHADGIIIAGPNPLDGAYLNYPVPVGCTMRPIGKTGARLSVTGLKSISEIRRAGRALPGLSRQDQSRTVHGHNADTCERLYFLVPFDAERAQEWSDRAAFIIEATRAGELLPRAYDDPQDWRCRMCSHARGAGDELSRPKRSLRKVARQVADLFAGWRRPMTARWSLRCTRCDAH